MGCRDGRVRSVDLAGNVAKRCRLVRIAIVQKVVKGYVAHCPLHRPLYSGPSRVSTFATNMLSGRASGMHG